MKSTLAEMCRCCLTTNTSLTVSAIDSDGGEWTPHINKIMDCFPDLKIEEYGSFTLCEICRDSLNSAHCFRKKIFKANVAFQHYIQKLRTQSEDGATAVPLPTIDISKPKRIETIIKVETIDEPEPSPNVEIKQEPPPYYPETEEFTLDIKVEEASTTTTTSSSSSSSSNHQNNPEDEESASLALLGKVDEGAVVDVVIQFERSKYQCEYCNKIFTHKNSLSDHTRIHTGERPYICEQCNKSFSQRSILLRHSRIHSGEKPYQCDQCDKSFVQKTNLQLHNRIHSGEKPFRCDYCHKSFSRNNHLVSHIRIHTHEKPFECELCKKSFSRMDVLKRHIRTHNVE